MLLIVAFGCVVARADEALSLADYIVPRKLVTYTRVDQYDQLPEDVGRFRVTQRDWAEEPKRVVWTECEQRVDRRAEPDCVRKFLGQDGYGNAASLTKAGAWEWWSPPQVVLPSDLSERLWSQVHQKRGEASRRSCELSAEARYCDDGLLLMCATEFANSKVVIGQHFCPGLGLVAEGGVADYGSGHRFRSFARDIVIDGVPAPLPRESP